MRKNLEVNMDDLTSFETVKIRFKIEKVKIS